MQAQPLLKPVETDAAATGVSPDLPEHNPRNPMSGARLLAFTTGIIGVLALGWTIGLKLTSDSGLSASAAASIAADNLDRSLQRAATLALANRRGAVIVMDPQTGRVRALVNPELAFAANLPPGSTLKPFTTLAALRSRVIHPESRTLCQEKYAHDEFHTVCSHPRDLPPLNPTEAIAYSCNYYFGKVGERLPESAFTTTLREFGFGKASGVNGPNEGQGQMRRTEWRSENALGEGDYHRATAIQVINAYSAMVNGGHLFTPQIGPAVGFVPKRRARLMIKDEHRDLILKGMRGAVRYGTAETANLYSVPTYVFGKTGTATEIGGFRTQGWFVGFASQLEEDLKDESEFAPERVKLAVLVFLPKAHGSDAAEIARPIFDQYARFAETRGRGDTDTRKNEETVRSNFAESPRLQSSVSLVRVHLVSENVTRRNPLEEYVHGVVAAEGSVESESEALKALAVASRTYALRNAGRHSADGYDFCSTTHCQRFRQLDSGSMAGGSSAVADAVESTKGQALYDPNNQLADSYFSASCGGATADIATLWGGNAPSHLRGVRDDYCTGEAHHSWTDKISQKEMLKALQTDPRTNVGERLVDVRVSRSDASGRAELMVVEGNRRITIKGWDFKIIVGRALGWNLLKSSRFTVSRSGSHYIFRGSGFGHGLGLCQEGAHVMAARGSSYRQILAKYFPGTDVVHPSELNADRAADSPKQSRPSADLLWNNFRHFEGATGTAKARFVPTTVRRTLSSEDFRISYPSTVGQREVERLLSFLQASRKSLLDRVAGAGVTARIPRLEIFINETTGDFVGRTGQPAWVAAATKGSRIELQPLETLKRRGILETTLRHELVHTLVEIVGRGRAPLWLAEGLALHLAGEGRLVARYQPRQPLSTSEIEKQLARLGFAQSANDMRATYAAAYTEVKRLIDSEGEANVWRRVAR